MLEQKYDPPNPDLYSVSTVLDLDIHQGYVRRKRHVVTALKHFMENVSILRFVEIARDLTSPETKTAL